MFWLHLSIIGQNMAATLLKIEASKFSKVELSLKYYWIELIIAKELSALQAIPAESEIFH